MSAPLIVWGLGELGGAFAHGFLRCGHVVAPVTRAHDPAEVARLHPEPELVLVAVGENDLSSVLDVVPVAWRGRLGLLQNELLPIDWAAHSIDRPTVASVWFEKKRTKPLNVVRTTAVAGPRARLLVDACAALDLPAEEVPPERLLFELVTKNLYILTTNIAGLRVGGTVSAFWRDHRALARDVAAEVLALQAWRAGEELRESALMSAMVEAFEGDPDHGCKGRSAPARLARALDHADSAGLAVPTLRAIASEAGVTPG